MVTRAERARQKIGELEKVSKHVTRTQDTDRQTKNDDLDDPSFNKKDEKVDPQWRQDEDGNWVHPNFK